MPSTYKRQRAPESQNRQNIARRLDRLIKEIDELQHEHLIYNSGLDGHMNDALQSVGHVLDNLPTIQKMIRSDEVVA